MAGTSKGAFIPSYASGFLGTGPWGFSSMYRVILASCLPLSACGAADTGARPAVEIKEVVRTVEVAKPCPVTKPDRPAKLARPLPADAVALAALLGAKLLEVMGPGGYVDRADAAISQCVQP